MLLFILSFIICFVKQNVPFLKVCSPILEEPDSHRKGRNNHMLIQVDDDNNNIEDSLFWLVLV